MRLLPSGDRALIAEFDSLGLVRAAHELWVAEAPAGIVELVPAARTVLVRIEPRVLGLGAAEQWLTAHAPSAPAGDGDGPLVEIAVTYDGDDLAVVAETWGCSLEAVATRHAATPWVCAFIGFAPGFGYLVPAPGAAALPPVPRRATSRPLIAAGSLGLAAEYSAVYPHASPGGWQLIGHTDAELWSLDRDSTALLAPGTRVRFSPRPA
jgi:KipI family sensor histidine kinase inhibitor